MAKFQVTQVTEIRTTFAVEAKNAVEAIRKTRRNEFDSSSHHSIEDHFIATEIKEELDNE